MHKCICFKIVFVSPMIGSLLTDHVYRKLKLSKRQKKMQKDSVKFEFVYAFF